MDDFYALERRLRREIREYINNKLSTVVRLLPYSLSSSTGERDKLQGYQTEGSDEQPYDIDGRRMFPFGLRSVPPKGVLGAWVGNPGSGQGLIVGADSKRFGPTDLADGEVALYNAFGTLIKLDKNNVASANGTTFAAPKWDDGASGGFVAALNTFVNSLAGLTPPIGLTACQTAIGAIITAAGTLKAAMTGASNYSSTKFKNG